jgi:hypothetical protein
MEQLKNVTAVVKHLLETEPQTRNNDGLLYVRVCQHYNPSIDLFPFGVVMQNQILYDIPSAETVRRARQKVQERNEHLKACKTVKEYRAENELKYKAFALDMQYE